MPELPEVETIVKDLKVLLLRVRFLELKSFSKNTVVGDRNIPDGNMVIGIKRRGKFINIFFENDLVMTIHLRMTGRLIFNAVEPKFERARIIFDKGYLSFCDQRRFGKIWISKISDYEKVTGINKLGIEPLNKEFSFEFFIERLSGKRGTVKKWLLDQNFIAGIGNIYADESCFSAGVRPDHRIENLTDPELKNLFESIGKVLKAAIRNRGTSFSDYRDAHGFNGKNQEKLFVYGRGGKECLICKNILQKIKLVGRSTVYCENCQN